MRRDCGRRIWCRRWGYGCQQEDSCYWLWCDILASSPLALASSLVLLNVFHPFVAKSRNPRLATATERKPEASILVLSVICVCFCSPTHF